MMFIILFAIFTFAFVIGTVLYDRQEYFKYQKEKGLR